VLRGLGPVRTWPQMEPVCTWPCTVRQAPVRSVGAALAMPNLRPRSTSVGVNDKGCQPKAPPAAPGARRRMDLNPLCAGAVRAARGGRGCGGAPAAAPGREAIRVRIGEFGVSWRGLHRLRPLCCGVCGGLRAPELAG